MWTCPKCGRSFKHENQNHACKLIDKDDLFAKRPPLLKKLYEKVAGIVKTFGEFREETVLPDVIFFKTKSSFLAVKVKKDHVEVEFFLDHVEDVPPIAKFLQTSKHRVAHVVKVDDEKDIDAQLIKWMKASYELINKD
jgi:predicted transport protein